MPAEPVAHELAAALRRLTMLEAKRRLYADDAYFRLALADARAVLGARAESVVRRHGLVLVKPEGSYAGKAGFVCAWLRAAGFVRILRREVRCDLTRCEALWRFQWNRATGDRMRLQARMMGRDACLVYLLRDLSEPRAGAGMPIPATVRLRLAKGASDPALRSAGCLRSRLGSPNRLVTFVHSPDEPADLLREIGILFEEPDRRRLFAAMADDAAQDHELVAGDDAGAREEAWIPRERREAWEWYVDLARKAGAGATEPADSQRDLAHLDDIAVAAGLRIDDWPVMLAAAAVIRTEIEGVDSIIGEDGAALWLTACGPMAPRRPEHR